MKLIIDFRVYIGITYSGNEVSDVRTIVNDCLGFETILWVPDIDPYYSQVRFGWSLDNTRLGHENNVIEYMSFFDDFFN